MSEWLAPAKAIDLWRYVQRHRYLLRRLVKREIEVRYRGAWLGALWALLTPLMMLAVYTFVFAHVLRVRWGNAPAATTTDFALSLFAGLTAFGILAETLQASPNLILGNVNYVKKVVFPLEILPVARLLACAFHAALNFGILLVACAVLGIGVHWTVVFLPIVLLPLGLLTLGCAYFLAPVGVLVRDVNHVLAFAVTMLLFLSAVFFPVSQLPPAWRPWLMLNPLVTIIDDVRRVTIEGLAPKWTAWLLVTALSAAMASAGLAWFLKVKRWLADAM